MSNLENALRELREKRSHAQSEIEKLDQIIAGIESLNGAVPASGKTAKPKRIISAASRRKMALAQRARYAKTQKESQPVLAVAKSTESAPAKRTMSASARRKIAAAQKARWASVRKESQPTLVAKSTGSAPAKRKLSAAGRKRIAAAQRARWAKLKAAKKAA